MNLEGACILEGSEADRWATRRFCQFFASSPTGIDWIAAYAWSCSRMGETWVSCRFQEAADAELTIFEFTSFFELV